MKIEDIKYISTKTGDSGTSVNYDNVRYSKDDTLFEALGTIDELSSVLGIVYQTNTNDEIKVIQKTLQYINSIIATSDETRRSRLRQITDEDISYLEDLEKAHLKNANITHEFVLPGSESLESAYLDLARTITRRVERRVVSFINDKGRKDLSLVLSYINRLSDLLFIMARKKR